MRVGIIGSKTLSCLILDAVLDAGHDVVVVYARDDEKGMKTWHEMGHRNLADEATTKGIAVHLGMKVNSPASLQLLESANLDIILSCFWSEIFKEPILNLPKLGCFNFHTAFLPKNRGSRPLPWALIKGETECGITVHRMMTGVDNGPIVAQERIPITTTDTGETLYEKATVAGGALAKQVISAFASGDYSLLLQDEELATYQPRGEPYGRQIDAYWDENRTDRFKRAFDFPPFAEALPPVKAAIKGAPSVYYLINTVVQEEDDLRKVLQSQAEPINLFMNPGHRDWEEASNSKVVEVYPLGPKNESLQIPLEKSASSRFVVQQLKQILDRSGAKGLRPHQCDRKGVGFSYRLLDVLDRRGVKFISSEVQPLEAFEMRSIQPHRHINGILEFPNIHLSSMNQATESMAHIQEAAERLLNEMNRDVFVGLTVPVSLLVSFLSHPAVKEVLDGPRARFITYSEVCEHFNAIYTKS